MPASQKKPVSRATQLPIKMTEQIAHAQKRLKEQQQLIANQKGYVTERGEQHECSLRKLNEKMATQRQHLAGLAYHKQIFLAHKVAAYHRVMQRPTFNENPGHTAPLRQEILRTIKEDLYTIKVQALGLSRIKNRRELEAIYQKMTTAISAIKYILNLLKTIGATHSDGLQQEYEKNISIIEQFMDAAIARHDINLAPINDRDLMNYSAITLNLGWNRERGFSPAPYTPVPKKLASPDQSLEKDVSLQSAQPLEAFKRTVTTKRGMTPSSNIGGLIHVSESRDMLFRVKPSNPDLPHPTHEVPWQNQAKH